MGLSSVTPLVSELVEISVSLVLLPGATLKVPPWMVPPLKFQLPRLSLSVRPPVRVPVRFTEPPEWVQLPRNLLEKVPPRYSVPAVTVVEPRLAQLVPLVPTARLVP